MILASLIMHKALKESFSVRFFTREYKGICQQPFSAANDPVFLLPYPKHPRITLASWRILLNLEPIDPHEAQLTNQFTGHQPSTLN